MISVNRLRSRRSLRLIVLPFWVAAGTWLVPPSVRVMAAASALPEGRLAKWMGVEGTGAAVPAADRPAGFGYPESGGEGGGEDEVHALGLDGLVEQFAEALRGQGQAVQASPRGAREDKSQAASGAFAAVIRLQGLRSVREWTRRVGTDRRPPVARWIASDNPQGP